MSAEEKKEFEKKLKEADSVDDDDEPIIQQASTTAATTKKQPAAVATTSPSTLMARRTSPSHKHQDGCRACGRDDDHNNLMFCDMCDNEYHYYCLDPPLQGVPTGDWFCSACKPHTTLHAVSLVKDTTSTDGLDPLVCALPPRFTERFGEVCWAHGGNGFGWWPACIYDPRLTVGGARELARKNLGRRHLVYFFECSTAPFSVLGDNKLVKWEEGIAESYHLGKTAIAHSGNRAKMFRQALHIACLEEGKPVDLRMIWNHQGDEPIQHIPLSPPLTRKKGRPRTSPLTDDVKPAKKKKRGAPKKRPASVTSLQEVLEEETEPVYCRVTKRTLNDESKDDENLGFISLEGGASFVDARDIIKNEMDAETLPPKDWKFFLPSLGPVSHRQEGHLGPLAAFLRKTFQEKFGTGTVDNPFILVIVGMKPRGGD